MSKSADRSAFPSAASLLAAFLEVIPGAFVVRFSQETLDLEPRKGSAVLHIKKPSDGVKTC